MHAYLKFAHAILVVGKLLTMLIVAGMIVSVLIGVFFRFVVPMPIAWPPEAARFLMVAVTMFGSSVAIRQLDHVGITFLVDMLPQRLALVLYATGNLLVMAFLLVFIWYSAKLSLEMGPRQVSSSLGMSMLIPYLSMPLGGAMMLIQQIAAFMEGIVRHREGQSPYYATLNQSSV